MDKKRKKRKKLKIKSVLIFLLFIAVIVLVSYLLLLLKVRTYFIYNNNYLSDEEVLKELKLNKNSSFLMVNNLYAKPLANKSKLIKNVKIKRNLDLEVNVDVEEYKVLFYDSKKNKTIIENGKSIDYIDANTPVLKNEIPDKEVYNKFVKKMAKIKNNVSNIISEITYSPNGIDKERFLFSMNDGNYVYVTITKLTKINDYKSIIDSVENKKGILYLDYGNYFVPKE